MKIDIDDINYIAKLAKLEFTEDEASDFSSEFEAILNHFNNINKYDLSDTDVNDYIELQGVLRKDEVKSFDNKKELYQNTKQKQDDYIAIPKVIE